jgi:hypothetical protein
MTAAVSNGHGIGARLAVYTPADSRNLSKIPYLILALAQIPEISELVLRPIVKRIDVTLSTG